MASPFKAVSAAPDRDATTANVASLPPEPESGTITCTFPVASLPPSVEQALPDHLATVALLPRIAALESRIVVLEAQVERFESALKQAGQFIVKSPMSGMMLAALPKEAQKRLREFFS